MKRKSNNARNKRMQARKRAEKMRVDRLHHFEFAKSCIQPKNEKLELFIGIGHMLMNKAQECGLPEKEFLSDMTQFAKELGITKNMLEKQYKNWFGVTSPVILSSVSLSPINNEAEKHEIVKELCGVDDVFFA